MLGSLIRFGALSAAGYGIFSALHHYSGWREAGATAGNAEPAPADNDTAEPVALNTGYTSPAASSTFTAN